MIGETMTGRDVAGISATDSCFNFVLTEPNKDYTKSYNKTNRCLLIIHLFSNKLGIPKDKIVMLWVFTKY